jgi:hypothetical protein
MSGTNMAGPDIPGDSDAGLTAAGHSDAGPDVSGHSDAESTVAAPSDIRLRRLALTVGSCMLLSFTGRGAAARLLTDV